MSRDVFSPKENLPFPSHRPIYPDHTSSLTLPGSFYFFHEENCRRRRDRVAARKRERKNVLHAISSISRNDVCVCVYIFAGGKWENRWIWIGLPPHPAPCTLRICGLIDATLVRWRWQWAQSPLGAPALFEQKTITAGTRTNITY